MAQPVQTNNSMTALMGSFPTLQSDDGMGDTQADITRLQAALHDLAYSIGLARQTGQTQAASMLQQQFNTIKAQVDALIRQQGAAEAAPTIFSRIGDYQTSVSQGVQSVTTALGGVGKSALWLALGVGAIFVLPKLIRRRG